MHNEYNFDMMTEALHGAVMMKDMVYGNSIC